MTQSEHTMEKKIMQANIERLATFAQYGQPKDYAASDMMRADLEVLVLQAAARPDKLLQIIAALYQIAGVYDAPTYVLDVLANPEMATQEQIDTLLPFSITQPETLPINHAEAKSLAYIKRKESNLARCYLELCEIKKSEKSPPDQKDAEIAQLQGVLTSALTRMDRARGWLTNDSPRPNCNWGVLDTEDLRAAIAQPTLITLQMKPIESENSAESLYIDKPVQPCLEADSMGEYACNNRTQCWESCGELGHSDEHARISTRSLFPQAVTLTKLDTWESTSIELTAITYEMDVIHERYSGKENRNVREELLIPLRLKCVSIGQRRQELVNPILQTYIDR